MSMFTIYESNDQGEQNYRWNLKDTNGEIIAHSEEPFHKQNALNSIMLIQKHVSLQSSISENGEGDNNSEYRFEYYKSENDGQWYWRLKSGGNHETMAIGEGYTSKSGIEAALENIRLEMTRAEIVGDTTDLQKWVKAGIATASDTTPRVGLAGS